MTSLFVGSLQWGGGFVNAWRITTPWLRWSTSLEPVLASAHETCKGHQGSWLMTLAWPSGFPPFLQQGLA